MELKTRRVGKITVCSPDQPKLDASNASDLKKAFIRIFVEESPSVILDLKDVSYLDSTGLGAILFGVRNSKNYGGQIKLVNPQPKVQKLIDIAQLGRVLEIFPSVEDALASFEEKSDR